MWHYLLQHTYIRTESVIVIKYTAARDLMVDIFKIAVIYQHRWDSHASGFGFGIQGWYAKKFQLFMYSEEMPGQISFSSTSRAASVTKWQTGFVAQRYFVLFCFFLPPSLLSFSLYFNPFLSLWRVLSHFLSFIFKSPHHISYSKCRSDERLICSLSPSLFFCSHSCQW